MTSWRLELFPLLGLLLTAWVYQRGWRRLHAQIPARFPAWRLASFLGGLIAVFLAVASPLDAFAGLLLQAHMIQHLLLTMLAPPLLLLGAPYLPLLCGLPRTAVREVLGPFLASPDLRRWGHRMMHPLVGGTAFLLSTLIWHLPGPYELALRSPSWHIVEHVCFLGTALLFWFPVVQPWPSRPHWPRWAMIPYLLVADLQNTLLGAFFSFHDRVLYPTYAEAPRLGGVNSLADQSAAGAIMWVPGSLAFLLPAGLILIEILGGPRGVRPSEWKRAQGQMGGGRARRPRPESSAPAFDLLCVRSVGPLLRSVWFRRACQVVLLAVAVGVVLDGLFGPPVSAVNLAGVLPWMIWRGLAVVALLVAGNIFCFACPFMLVRDAGRRFLPARWTWPRGLRSKWPAVGLVGLYLWAGEAFHLWDRPSWTAWIIVGYFGAALLVDGLFSGARFCKHLCPIGQFNFTHSLASPLEVKVRQPDLCRSCTTQDCLRGNEVRRGCELELLAPRKSGNLDCTFCLDCVRACPQENVGVLAVVPALDLTHDRARSSIGKLGQRPDLAALILLLTVGAWAGPAQMTAPVLRWQETWSGLGLPPGWPVITVFFLGCLAATSLLVAWASWLSRSGSPDLRAHPARVVASSFIPSFVPLSLALWGAHLVYHLFIGLPLVQPVLARAAGDVGIVAWGAPEWSAVIPGWVRDGLPTFQLLLLDAGFLLSLYLAWRVAGRLVSPGAPRLAPFMPWGLLLALLYGLGFWIFLQPMEMRGLPGQSF